MRTALALPAILLPSALLTAGCFGTSPSSGGGQVRPADAERRINPADVALPAGYRIEAVATRLTFPTAVAFDDQNRPYVVEAGYSYGEFFAKPRLVRIEPGGGRTEIAAGADNGPWTGVAFHGGNFYVAEGGVMRGGAILRVSPDGKITPLIQDLPSKGDHHTNGPAVSPDGSSIYFSIGVATNSGVVGTDNAHFGWLKRDPSFHDIPAKDIKLTGENFTTENPLSNDKNAKAVTGAYLPFNTPSQPGQVIPGKIPCTGGIFKMPLAGGEAQLVAWGLRNPFGLAFAPDGRLFCTENSYDVRGSRPVYGSGDVLWPITPGTWYGWPDFHAGYPLTWSDHYQAPGKPAPKFLLAEHPNAPPTPAAVLPVHGSYCGFDFSRSSRFGFAGQAFIAAFGDMAPGVGKVMAPVGFRVDRVDPNTGVIEVFAANRGKDNGPASRIHGGGLERPVAARFDNTGEVLYVVDFGVMSMDGDKPQPRQETGVLWRIIRTATVAGAEQQEVVR